MPSCTVILHLDERKKNLFFLIFKVFYKFIIKLPATGKYFQLFIFKGYNMFNSNQIQVIDRDEAILFIIKSYG